MIQTHGNSTRIRSASAKRSCLAPTATHGSRPASDCHLNWYLLGLGTQICQGMGLTGFT